MEGPGRTFRPHLIKNVSLPGLYARAGVFCGERIDPIRACVGGHRPSLHLPIPLFRPCRGELCSPAVSPVGACFPRLRNDHRSNPTPGVWVSPGGGHRPPLQPPIPFFRPCRGELCSPAVSPVGAASHARGTTIGRTLHPVSMGFPWGRPQAAPTTSDSVF